ncbi:MAG TPA: imidazole glycerol phosphate synthase subunit HisH [Candidatus Micrarchaeia archaeon]|nr:imidazole glycerol phosphate synthase subunit HisH [Candidatus Micrarchaeia archaeon]
MSGAPVVAVLDGGTGNLRSVTAAIRRAGGEPTIAATSRAARAAVALVVPGVGAFDQGIAALRAGGLDHVVLDFAQRGRPVLGVCLGMHLLHEGSDEGEAAGLGLLPGRAHRLRAGGAIKVPHMGWNTVRWSEPHPFLAGLPSPTRFYFVHSYAVPAGPPAVAAVTHGEDFAAASARGSVFATQFHPERSGAAGLVVYRHLVEAARCW